MSRRAKRRAGGARMGAYRAHESLLAAVLRGSHPRRIEELRARAVRLWTSAARLHRGDVWRAVALWHARGLERGVLDCGSPVPRRLHETWRVADVSGLQYLYRIGLPHYGCGPVTMIDGSRWYPANGTYERVAS